MTRLTFTVGANEFTSMKEAHAFRDGLVKANNGEEWGIPEVVQKYTEVGLEPHGVYKFEEFTNPKLKIRGC